MQLFRIKNNYVSTDQETGEMAKFKDEYLVSAVNYTDAEAFIVEYNEINGLNKYSPADYEISKDKITPSDIYLNDVIAIDMNPGLKSNNFAELYFSGENDRLFGITVKYFGNKEEGTKTFTETYYIPGYDMENAVNYFNTKIVDKMSDYMITKTTADKMCELYITHDILESIRNR